MFEPDFEGCKYCGYPLRSHPVTSVVDSDETFCDEFISRDGDGNVRQRDTGKDRQEADRDV